MKISTKGRYALRLMTDLANSGQEGYVSLKDVAARQNISQKYLEQIAGSLAKAGLLQSGRGAQIPAGQGPCRLHGGRDLTPDGGEPGPCGLSGRP